MSIYMVQILIKLLLISLTCNAGMESNCLTCNSTYNRTISGNYCPCDAGYYN